MKRVLKWTVHLDDQWHPIGPGPVLHVGVQPGMVGVTVWTLEDLDGPVPVGAHAARVYGTGQPVPDDVTHAGSVIDPPFVWHVFTTGGPPAVHQRLLQPGPPPHTGLRPAPAVPRLRLPRHQLPLQTRTEDPMPDPAPGILDDVDGDLAEIEGIAAARAAFLDTADLDTLAEVTHAATQRLTNAAVGKAVTDLSWTDAAAVLDTLRRARWDLDAVMAALTRHIYLTGEHGKTVLDGIGQISVTRSRDRKRWDERGVARAVIDAHMEARQGEAPADPWDVVEWLLEAVAINYARTTVLRGLGIEPDAFCDSEPGTPRVTFPPLDG